MWIELLTIVFNIFVNCLQYTDFIITITYPCFVDLEKSIRHIMHDGEFNHKLKLRVVYFIFVNLDGVK